LEKDRPTGVVLFDSEPAIENLRSFLAGHYRLHGYALSALRRAAHHFTTPELKFVVLRGANRPCILQALAWIRTQSYVAVIIVGPADESTCVAALEQGADDYVFEPASPRELLARVRAMVRSRKPLTKSEELPEELAKPDKCSEEHVYAFAGWEYDARTRCLTNPGRSRVSLTRSEYALLKAFLDSPQRTLTREYLIQATRIVGDIFERSITVSVARLRRKLSMGGATTCMISTERSLGYKFHVAVERRRSRPAWHYPR
jgi:two-component system OmpR family response regulator